MVMQGHAFLWFAHRSSFSSILLLILLDMLWHSRLCNPVVLETVVFSVSVVRKIGVVAVICQGYCCLVTGVQSYSLHIIACGTRCREICQMF